MSWKTIIFTNSGTLHIKNYQLVYQADDSNESITIPMEDIGTIILENPQITITNYMLSLCSEYKITVLTCDKKHKPIGILTPFYQHSRNTKIALAHINIKESLKKQLWQKIIKQKIKNQSDVIKILFNDNRLDNYINKVQSGDNKNVEGQVSKIYWQLLFNNFKRHSSDKYNSALDYGYAILRSSISKYIASSGLIPCLGVHHCNELNPFNLTEDLIEAFRPFVDLMVCKMEIDSNSDLTKSDKLYLLSILTKQCQYKGEQITIQNACENVCKTFVKTILEKDVKLLELPEFIEEK